MKSFTYERARNPADAAAAALRNPDTKFIAGGTNLLDLMKLEIETPAHLIDVNGLALDKIETTPAAGRFALEAGPSSVADRANSSNRLAAIWSRCHAARHSIGGACLRRHRQVRR